MYSRTSFGCAIAGVGAALFLAGPAVAASPTDTLTEFIIPSGPGKGLIAVTQGPAGSELSFMVAGLSPRTKYTMVISSKGCRSSKGTLVRRGFTTDGRGVAWDPVLSRATATPKSVRILKGRQMIVCNPAGHTHRPLVSAIKVTAPKALVSVSRASTMWTASVAVGGLTKNTRYQFAAVQGGCTAGARTLMQGFFTTDRKGFGVLDLQESAMPGFTIDAVGVLNRATGKVMFCQTL